MDEEKIFITGWGEVEKRLDPHYSQPKYQRLMGQLSRFNLVKLRQASTRIFSGMTPLSGGDAYTTETDGIAFIRSGDFGHDGSIDFSDVIYIKPETHQKMMRSSHLKKGDVLFAIVGATIGKVSHFPYGREANINQAVCAVRLKGDIEPEYVAAFFQTLIGQQLLNRAKRPVARANINLEEIGQLVIPKVGENLQRKVVELLREGYTKRQKKIDQVSALLASIDDYLLGELGINLPPEPENTIANRIFIVKHRELEQRFDPAYFSSKFSRIQHALEAMPHTRLRDVAFFSSEQWDQGNDFGNEFPYLEISAINTRTGEVTGIDSIPVGDAPSRARMFIRKNDILVSTTRPSRGAITLVGDDIQTPVIASTGFSVIRHVDESKISKEFLLILLRSRLCLLQLEQRSSGGNYPAITQSELGRVLLPSVAPAIQERVVTHVKVLHVEAKHLRQQAETELENAKRRIEAMLLGEVTP